MTLHIDEIAWGINRKNGDFKQSVTAKAAFPCIVGPLPEFGRGKRNFVIVEVGENHIVLSVRYEKNPAADQSWTLELGDEMDYMPRSMDGGYKYHFALK